MNQEIYISKYCNHNKSTQIGMVRACCKNGRYKDSKVTGTQTRIEAEEREDLDKGEWMTMNQTEGIQ